MQIVHNYYQEMVIGRKWFVCWDACFWCCQFRFHFHRKQTISIIQPDYRSSSLTSVVCNQMEHVIAGYQRQIWHMCEWLYEGQRGFRPGYSCESQIVTVCQDVADSLGEVARIDAKEIGFSKAFYLVPYDRMLMKIAASGVDSRVVV
jgi:hypothetical protein